MVRTLFTLILFGTIFVTPNKADSGHFWQLTDLHWDQQYALDGDPDGMCHTNEARKKLSLENSNEPDFASAGQYGTYSCDAPWDLIELSIKGMADNSAVPDFIIWTGDNTPHVKDPEPDWPVVFSSLKNVSRTIRHNFPNTTLIPVLGNHDVFPGDLYPSEAGFFYRAYLTEGEWNELLPPSAQDSFVKCGFYTIDVKSDLQVIVLNTNLYNIPNNLTRGVDDPCGQLSWFEQQLQLAQSKRIKVLVAAHIPPGFFERWIGPPFYNPGQNDRYIQLIHRYGHVILTHVYGHTHTDSFRLFADDSAQIKSVAFVAPSVTPWLHQGGVNPSLRLYNYNATEVNDYWQYYLNLARINRTAPVVPEWQLLYQATAAYGIKDLSKESMLQVYRQMLTDPSVFERYYFHNTVGHVFQECDAACMRDHLCTISHLTQDDMQSCQEGVHVFFRKEPLLAARFADITSKARMASIENWLLIAVLTTLAFLSAVFGAIFAIKHARGSHSRLPFGRRSRPVPRVLGYVSISTDEDV